MFHGFTRRDLVIGAIAMFAATVLTVEGTYYVLHSYVLNRPDPLHQQGGMKPGQVIK
jgi:hypothetical protein